MATESNQLYANKQEKKRKIFVDIERRDNENDDSYPRRGVER